MLKNTKAIEFLSSVRLALILLIVITLISFTGCFIPAIYYSWYFILVLVFFSLNLILCSVRRLKVNKRRIGSTITHLSIIVILFGALVSYSRGIRGVMELYEGESRDTFFTDRELRNLPFKVFLEDFSLEWHKPTYHKISTYILDRGKKQDYTVFEGKEYKIKGTPYSFCVINYLPGFSITEKRVVENRSGQPDNPAVLLRIKSENGTQDIWVFSKHPHMSFSADKNIEFFYSWEGAIKEFRSSVKIIDNDKVVLAKDIKVNAPLKYKGYTFYQSGYDAKRLNTTVLQVVSDPGVGIVFLGFVLLNIGIALNFYFKLKYK